MTFQISEKFMKRAVPHLTMVTVLAVLSLCMTSMAYSATPSAPAAVKTYSVTLTPSPKSQSVAPGGTATVTITDKNSGTSAFMVTGCVLEIATTSTGPYSKSSCSVTAPYAIPAHGSVKTALGVTFSTTAAAGKYYFRFYNTGTVGTSSDKTKMASFTVTVT
jgi:hypothetical protein